VTNNCNNNGRVYGNQTGQISGEALVELAEYTLETGRNERAIELLERAIQCHGQAAQPVLLLGNAWEAEGQYDKALATYVAALQKGVASAEIESMLFRQDFLLSTYPRSIAELAVMAVRKKSGQLWRLLARVCEINTNYDDALTFLTAALQVDPQDIAALSMLARVAEKRGQLKEAARWHRRVLEINPHLLVSTLFLAQQHFARDEYAAALPYLTRLRVKHDGNRMYQLLWLLARLHATGINGVEGQVGDIEQWRDLTPEEQALAQELLLVAGECSLAEGRTRAEQYLAHAGQLAPSPRHTPRPAAVDQRTMEQAIYQKVLARVAHEEPVAEVGAPAVPPGSVPKDLRWSPEKGWQKRHAWLRRVLPWFAAQRVGVCAGADEQSHRR